MCEAACNTTASCVAFVNDPAQQSCDLLRTAGPGSPSPGHDAYVRVAADIEYDWTGSYNAAPPVCPDQPTWQCRRYVNSWFPNATATGAKVFP